MASPGPLHDWIEALPEDGRYVFARADLDDVTDALAGALEAGSPWIAGERFTAADVYVGAQITWGLRFGTLPRRAPFEDYAARLMARPAFGRAAALDDGAMPAKAGAD